MVRIGICEDMDGELRQQEQMLRRIMDGLSKNIELYGFPCGEDLLCEIEATGNMDIIFLDVEMSGMNGIETAKVIRRFDTSVVLIFISCHDQYCREMIEVWPYAFLEKPLQEDRLAAILKDVVEKRLNFTDVYDFSYRKKRYRIPLSKIRYFQSDRRTIRIDTADREDPEGEYLFYDSLDHVEDAVNRTGSQFIRVRKSYLVNPLYIVEYSANKVILDNGLDLEISGNYKEAVRKRYLQSLKEKKIKW